MARPRNIEKMTHAELVALRDDIDRVIADKAAAGKEALKQKFAEMAKSHGLSLDEIVGGRRKSKGLVAVKYRDPNNAGNTWTGRGRMPRWMVAATKGGKAKREDFLV